MSQSENTWTMQQFRHSFEAVVAAATKAPQMITTRGVPAYVLVRETNAAAKRAKAEKIVTLHKLKRPRSR